jgi:catechol 2,3-dioxygenase-like lactoylglutathione lyase family enzyme
VATRSSTTRARRSLAVLALLALLRVPAAWTAPLVRAVDSVGMTVADVERSRRFYTDVLGFRSESDVVVEGPAYERLEGVSAVRMRVVRLRLGDEALELTEYAAPRGRPIAPDSRSNDRWFQHVAIIVRSMDAAYARLHAAGVEHVSPAPQRLPDWNPAAGGIRAFYFRDPDGHPLEVLEFPAGKGDAKWRRPGAALFLGIDHTAIVVGDTERSRRFYSDTLGLRLAGESENHGVEQERLNAVPGAHLRITTLRASAGPGVELLEYLHPRDGRPIPPDVRANDVVHWQTRFVAPDVRAAERVLCAAGAPFVSPAAVQVPGRAPGFGRAVLLRDPDGHAVQVVH